ncbi:MAG: tetratricopeptide repeat protein [Planctomycetaceae bacterium]
MPTTKPSFPTPGMPGGGGVGGNRPGRPGLGDANRPTTLPGTIGGNRPGIGGNRPTTLPGDLGGGGGNRPSGGGNRPSIGGDRPGIGGDRPGGGGDRPVRPGDLGGGGHWNEGHRPGRPGLGGNRPGIGDNNAIWNNGNWNSGNWNGNHFNNNFNNVNVGGWGYGGFGGGYGWGNPGWGYGGGWNNNWNNGWVNPHYGGWYNGGWGNNWGYGGGWWAPFLTGAATWGLVSSLGSWGLGYGSLGYGAAGYVNPYYASMPATVVASSPYDYSQPVIINNYIPADSAPAAGGEGGQQQQPQETAAQQPAQTSPADAAVDSALAQFKAGDYASALAGFDQALKLSPKDSVIHEVRALALFALGRYPEAAAALNAVLATAPGMDWTTMSNVYGSVDAYTGHLRKLEEFCRSHPNDAAAHFVLAYHYLVGGHTDTAAAALRVVVAQQPGDVVAKRLLDALAPPAAEKAAVPDAAATPQAPETSSQPATPDIDLVGTWKASGGKEKVTLTVTADSTFTWKAEPEGKPAIELKGTIDTAADAIALVSESAGTMVARVTPKSGDSFEFALPSAPKDAPPLLFARQP